MLGQLVSNLEDLGLAPNVFTEKERKADEFGRSVATLVDYAGRTVELASPSEIARSHVHSPRQPQAILRVSVIRGTSEPLRFMVREESPFEAVWRDWPAIVQAPPSQSRGEGGGSEVVEIMAGDVS
jgi:hypothetical protein